MERKSVLVVGSGAREHAICLALSREGCSVVCAPGNPGTERLGRNADVASDDVSGLVALAEREKVALVVVGPELPLTHGLVDALAEKNIPAFGPSRAAARLEASKAFMKEFLKRHRIPTADFEVFTDPERAKAYVHAKNKGLVVKADGLCAGKGVVVAATAAEAVRAIDDMMGKRVFGDAGATVVVEEFLPGEEASFHVLSDGVHAVALAAAQDHKRVFDADRGPNTGGMGAYAPAPIVTPEVRERVMRTIVEPTLAGMRAEGMPFRGVLFVGLMIEDGTPRVLEYNVRFGDPEAGVLFTLHRAPWFSLLNEAATGTLSTPLPAVDGAALSVVMAAEGYPAKPRTGDLIEGDLGDDVLHAGTKQTKEGVVTAGGRVLNVVGRGATLEEAASRAYARAATIRWPGEHHRSDIGSRALRRP